MEPIRNFAQLIAHLKTLNKRKRIAVTLEVGKKEVKLSFNTERE